MEQEGPLAFMILEFIDGINLKRLMFDRNGPLTLGEIKYIVQPLGAALQYAHQEGYVHCDLKSENILFDRSGTPYSV